MKNHVIAFAVLASLVVGITLSKVHAYSRIAQNQPIKQVLRDGDPKPPCPDIRICPPR